MLPTHGMRAKMTVSAILSLGSIYLDDCQGRRLIPIWLIVFGVFSLIQTMINVFKRCIKYLRRSESDAEGERPDYGSRGGSFFESIITFFLFVWIIIGSVWVFGFYNQYRTCQENDLDASVCCEPVPYLFSFVTLVVMYVVSFLSLCCCCCCIICIAACVGAAGDTS